MAVSRRLTKLDEYQAFVTSSTKHRDHIYPVLGLNGEVGEFTEIIKKLWREHGADWPTAFKDPFVRADAVSEMGDILWYLTRIASNLGISLEEVANKNRAKIMDRITNGKMDVVV